MRAHFLLVPIVVLSLAAAGAECRARSGSGTTALIELYTSQGCSSCPPADRWLSRLTASEPDARVIALAFHVDYWDYIGWTDRLASPAWSARQREAVSRSGGRVAYTPQVMLNGRNLSAWHSAGKLRESLEQATARPSVVELALRVAHDGRDLRVFAAATGSSGNIAGAELMLALAESRIVSDVRAGENRGKTLAHDHVVRALVPAGRIGKEGRLAVERQFRLAPGWKVEDLSVTAFVQDPRNGEVWQSLRLANCVP